MRQSDPREEGFRHFSIIIPTKNRPADLRSTIESIFRQTALPDQLILVDQSPDMRSRNEVESVYHRLSAELRDAIQLIYLQDTSIVGPAAARNRGLDKADGQIVLFLDDDVTLEGDFLHELSHVYLDHPEAAGVSGIITNYRSPALPTRLRTTVFERGPFRDDRQPLYWRADRLRSSEPVPVTRFTSACMSFRAEAIRTLRFDEAIEYAYEEDTEFCVRARSQGALLIAPRARIAHHRSSLGRSADHPLKKEARAAFHLYRKHWRRGFTSRLCFAWLNIGYALWATLASLRRRSLDPWIALITGCRSGRQLASGKSDPSVFLRG